MQVGCRKITSSSPFDITLQIIACGNVYFYHGQRFLEPAFIKELFFCTHLLFGKSLLVIMCPLSKKGLLSEHYTMKA